MKKLSNQKPSWVKEFEDILVNYIANSRDELELGKGCDKIRRFIHKTLSEQKDRYKEEYFKALDLIEKHHNYKKELREKIIGLETSSEGTFKEGYDCLKKQIIYFLENNN